LEKINFSSWKLSAYLFWSKTKDIRKPVGRSKEHIWYFSARGDGVVPHLNVSNSDAQYPPGFKYPINMFGNKVPSFPKNTCLSDQVTNYPWLNLSLFHCIVTHGE